MATSIMFTAVKRLGINCYRLTQNQCVRYSSQARPHLFDKYNSSNHSNHGCMLRRYFGRKAKVKDVDPDKQPKEIWVRTAFTAALVPTFSIGGLVYMYENSRKNALKRMTFERKEEKFSTDQGLRYHMNAVWNSFSPIQKFVVAMVAANTGVCLLWRIPQWEPYMLRYFSCMPYKGNSVTSMLWSACSHASFVHLAVNMYVMSDFLPATARTMGFEATVGFYFAAAIFSSYLSCLNKYLRRVKIPSMGASGAVLGLIGVVALTEPAARLCVPVVVNFFPHSFSAGSAVMALAAFDSVGLVLGWKVLDHAAHLGGVLFAVLFTYFVKNYGQDVIQKWRQLRKPL